VDSLIPELEHLANSFRRDYSDYLKNEAKSGGVAVLDVRFGVWVSETWSKIDPVTGVTVPRFPWASRCLLLCFFKPILVNRYSHGRGWGLSKKNTKDSLMPISKKNQPLPYVSNSSGWYGRLRGPISQLVIGYQLWSTKTTIFLCAEHFYKN